MRKHEHITLWGYARDPGILAYNAEAKDRFHFLARKFLAEVAAEMGLKKSEYDLRSSRGGIAVGGEVILHTDFIYIQIGGLWESTFSMFRSCKGRADYTGGKNNFLKADDLLSAAEFTQKVREALRNA